MINEFIKWQSEKSSRNVEINITKDGLKIWVYDFNLAAGQHVKNVGEINLEQKVEADEKKELKRLKAKYTV